MNKEQFEKIISASHHQKEMQDGPIT